jgi:DNA-binding transcriptional regulator YiaG
MAHDEKKLPKGLPGEVARVQESNKLPQIARPKLRKEYDATGLVGIRTIVRNAAIERTDQNGETTIELPKLEELMAAAAVSRCLMPLRLRGPEIKAIRKIMGKTMAEFAKELDERTATETISRWESEAQLMGTYAEKCLRLLVCEELSKAAPGVSYQASMIAALRIADPWKVKLDFEVPPVSLELIRVKEQSGEVIDAWNALPKAA